MRLYMVPPAVDAAQRKMCAEKVTDRLHYCYRCYDCGRLITKLEILEARAAGRVNLCPCGSIKIRITNPKWWEELVIPRMWRLIYAYYTKRVAPPPPPPSKEEQEEADRTARAAMRAFEEQAEMELQRSR